VKAYRRLAAARTALAEGGPFLLASRAAVHVGLAELSERLAAEGAARALRRQRPADRSAALRFAQQFEYGGLRIDPIQVPAEIEKFLELVTAEPPERVLEIGTARGGTLFLLTTAAAEEAVLVAVDAPLGARSFGGDFRYQRRRRLFEAFARERQRVVYLALDSHRQETFDRVQDALAGRLLDLLFIDGDHSYAGLTADYEMYVPLVRSGGLVAFHDIVPGPPEAVGGVPDFWRQVRDETALELVEDWDQGGWGIGVLRV